MNTRNPMVAFPKIRVEGRLYNYAITYGAIFLADALYGKTLSDYYIDITIKKSTKAFYEFLYCILRSQNEDFEEQTLKGLSWDYLKPFRDQFQEICELSLPEVDEDVDFEEQQEINYYAGLDFMMSNYRYTKEDFMRETPRYVSELVNYRISLYNSKKEEQEEVIEITPESRPSRTAGR